MLTFGWGEIFLLVGIIIIVVGPKDLPKLIKQLSSFTRSIKKLSREFKTSLNDIADHEDFKEVKTSINEVNKIKEDLENANKFKEQSEAKLKEYGLILDKAKKEVNKIHFDSKTALDKDIQSKKEVIEKEIEKEILKAQKEISELKKNSISSIQNISENITANIIENISGDKLNESSVKSAVEEISKKNLIKYL